MHFSDSVDENLEVVRELLKIVPPEARGRAKKAAVELERAWDALRKDNPTDKAVALGAAFAVFTIAQRITKAEQEAPSRGLIQLLS